MSASPHREVRTRGQLADLLHHGFWIPIAHGFTQQHVAENYPGWTWNALIRTLHAAGVVAVNPGGPLKCRDEVVRVHFDSDEAWLVEWNDGTVTRGPAVPGTMMPDASRGPEYPVNDLATGLMVEGLNPLH